LNQIDAGFCRGRHDIDESIDLLSVW
jgi:hypothetical protein